MKHFKSISELHKARNLPMSENPLLSLITCVDTCAVTCGLAKNEYTTDFYSIAFKKLISGSFNYGRTKYDHNGGSMTYVKPGQVVELKNIKLDGKGFTIMFHRDFLNGEPLHQTIKKYSFFDYETNEALHISPREEEIMWELFHKIETEYNNNQDEFSKEIIIGHIEAILKYSQRFYKRQFLNRSELTGKITTKFNKAIRQYFENGALLANGLPTVAAIAAQLKMSPSYLSDLLRQETGKPAIDHIHSYLISEAKNLLIGADLTVAEIAYQLGFENPPYFSRLFKKETGLTPIAYRDSIN
ncbi:helix-turn-helix transcriptional regulator [Mucilaginibacter sp. BJC16-A38]|uniref:helix-turn-helix domain-containing protein n=1 Tax=Mucilaginibacter phenanthrenivorans TaxID=1234842 RepID=UPI002158418B|nr:helix-turn-helix transcriptional regulator [Mucilaginibacter phenanthrenivorans]MCR8558085.1 helix-turn-helix transcriptional regulator [Mucilaginibacter phenanthrenivorans]